MESQPVDLSLKSDDEYTADIWYWKAWRTNPVGYADDKYHIYTAIKEPKAKELTSRTGRSMYLIRKDDSGISAYYKSEIYEEYKGDMIPKYSHRTPTGSRADIRAKGTWSNGRWIIEFARKLVTGHSDDIQFSDLSKSYYFGVSIYEIAGGEPDPTLLSNPFYGAGDVSEPLILRFGGQTTKATLPPTEDVKK